MNINGVEIKTAKELLDFAFEKPESDDEPREWPGPRETWSDNYTGSELTPDQRERLAEELGPNWASIIGGCGDQ